MRNWKELYDAKKMTSDEAVQLIKSNDKVVFQHDVGEPAELVRAMVRNAKNYRNVEISHMFSLGPGDYCKEEYKENFHPNMCSFPDRPERRATIGAITRHSSSMSFLSS